MTHYIDTHAHLYAKDFDADRDEMLQKAISEGVHKFYLPNVDSASLPKMLELEAKYPTHCFAMMGLHPCSVKENYKEELDLVRQYLDKREFCAIGEIGIDLYWDKTFFKEQQDAFRMQIQWAKEFNRPFVIHARDSMNEILEIVEAEQDGSLRGIFHCYSGDIEQTKRVQALGGFLLGIGGVVTFKNSGKTLREVLEHVNVNELVLETDAPYLSPVPYRGKRNESSYIPLIAAKLAEIKGVTLDKLASVTSENARNLFYPFV